jgi:TonB family protein
VRWDSPFVLAMAGTIAVHILVITVGDALVVTNPPRPFVPPPHIELVEIEVPPTLTPPPPPPPPPAPAPEPVVPAPAPRPQIARAVPSHPRSAPEPAPAPVKTDAPVTPSGGDQVVQMDDIAPAATGVGVAVGKQLPGHIGRGGSGGGTGAGSGSGVADEPAKPVSIASIKTGAQPKHDYSTDTAADYPAEAKALRIEGDIKVRLVVDDRGAVKSRVLLNKLGHGLDELAMQRAGKLEFIPAKDTDDRPVSSVVVWTFHMTLPAS